jgi:hypothetical protein
MNGGIGFLVDIFVHLANGMQMICISARITMLSGYVPVKIVTKAH